MSKINKKILHANRQAWDEVAPMHEKLNFQSVLDNFMEPGHSSLNTVEDTFFKKIGLKGKAVAQLGCNNGQELISIKNKGAFTCVGFDFSEKFIKQARLLSKKSGVLCKFVRSDIYQIPQSYYDVFDIVFVSVGVVRWLPDLDGFFQIIERLLKTGGWLFIHEMHPILDMFIEGDKRTPPPLQYSYFTTEPRLSNEGLDYYSKTKYISKVMYEFHHKLSDILSSCSRHGLVLENIQEFPNDISSVYNEFEDIEAKLPLSYALLAHKIRH